MARSGTGETVHFPVQRNLHRDGILAVTEVNPGVIDPVLAQHYADFRSKAEGALDAGLVALIRQAVAAVHGIDAAPIDDGALPPDLLEHESVVEPPPLQDAAAAGSLVGIVAGSPDGVGGPQSSSSSSSSDSSSSSSDTEALDQDGGGEDVGRPARPARAATAP